MWSSDDGKCFPQKLLWLIIACLLRNVGWDKMKKVPFQPFHCCFASHSGLLCFSGQILNIVFSPNYFHKGIVTALWHWVMIPAIIKMLRVCVLKVVALIYDCNICFVSPKSARIEKHLTGQPVHCPPPQLISESDFQNLLLDILILFCSQHNKNILKPLILNKT